MLLDDINRKITPCGYGSPPARGRRMVSGVTANCFNRYCCDKRKAFAHASAAKQSIVRLSKKLDCFAALAMTTSMGIRLGATHPSAFSRRECARVVPEVSAFHWEGRGECRVPTHPQPRMQSKKAYELVTTGRPEYPAFPHAMVLTVSFVISPVIGFVVTVALLAQSLTPASRRQDHTTSPSAFSTVRQRCLQ